MAYARNRNVKWLINLKHNFPGFSLFDMRKAFPEVPFRLLGDSDNLKLLAPVMPYRHQFFWQTRHDHEPGQDSLCAAAAIFFVQPFRTSGRCLPGQQEGDGLLGLEPFHLPGLRAIHAPVWAARFGGMSERPANQALSHWASQHGLPLDAGRCRRAQRLSVVRGARAAFDRSGLGLVWGRGCRPGAQGASLRNGLDHHRSVPVSVSLGPFPADQGRCQSLCNHGSARRHPRIHQHYDRQGARCAPAQCNQPASSWIDFGGRQGVPRFRKTPCPAPSANRLCDSRQGQSALYLDCFQKGQYCNRAAGRSDDPVGHAEVQARVPGAAAPRVVSGSADWKASGISHQSSRPTSIDNCRDLQKPLADRTLLQEAQAEPGRQAFFCDSINAVKAQIWVTVCAYLLLLIASKHHRLPVSPQIF